MLANRIFTSSPFDQGLFDNQGGLALGQVSIAIMFTPSWIFEKSHELASHELAIRLYCLELEAAFDSHFLPLIGPPFLVVYLVLVRFSWPAPLLGKHIIKEFILFLFVSIKAGMDLLSTAILLQLKCV